MSRNMAVEDYFSLKRTNKDGNLSPMTPYSAGGSSNSGNPLHMTLSWGNTPPEYAGLSKVKSHTGAVSFKNTSFVNKSQSDTKVYPYHKVHLTVNVPKKLKPRTPDDVIEEIAGQCIKCPPDVKTNENSHTTTHTAMRSPSRDRKNIKLKPILSKRGNKLSEIDSHFSNSVSFDTVNLKFFDQNDIPDRHPFSSDESDTGDETRDTRERELSPVRKSNFMSNDDLINRGRNKMSLPTSSKRTSSKSPNRSLSPRARSPLPSLSASQYDMVPDGDENMKNFFSAKYPTSPIITHDASTLTRTHKLFDDMYAGRLKSLVPKLHNRVIMCYISGRKHTWVGIDWAANQLLEDGDTLVIVSAIKNPGRSLERFKRRASNAYVISNNLTENIVRNSPEYAQAVTENIMKYALAVINPDRVVKITVELAIGSTRDVFQDMFELYQPSLVIVGSKPGVTAPTKSWSTKRLSDKIVKTSPVPTIIVSPSNMGLFETKLFKALDRRMKYITKDTPNSYHENDQVLAQLDNVGIYSLEDQKDYIKTSEYADASAVKEIESVSKSRKSSFVNNKKLILPTKNDLDSGSDADDDKSDSDSDSENVIDSDTDSELGTRRTNSEYDDESVDSTNPPAFIVKNKETPKFKLNRLNLEAEIRIFKETAKFESEPLNKDSFKHLLTIASDSYIRTGIALAESAKQGEEQNKLVRTITGAAEQLQRRKSMVSDTVVKQDDFDEKLKRFQREKQIKEREKLNRIKSAGSFKTPKINIEAPPMPNLAPPSSSLKSGRKSPSPTLNSMNSTSSIGSTLDSPINSDSGDKKTKKKSKKKSFFGGLFGKK